MRESGFSLIELIVAVAIIGTLITVATMNFSEMTRKAHIESQIKMMYADLMTIRSQALLQKQERSAVVATTGGVTTFSIYSSGEITVAPVSQRVLHYPVVWNSTGVISFDTRGLETNPLSICVEPSGNPANQDSIVVSATRINMGKRNAGGGCAATNIIVK